MNRVFSNPFFVYVISFLVVFLVYSLGWSNLYPHLSSASIVFFITTFILAIFFGIVIHAMKKIHFEKLQNTPRLFSVTVFIYTGYLLEFAYNGGVPLQLILQGQDYDYRLFGIPTFHVFLSTFNSFYAVYVFHHLRSKPSKAKFFYFVLNLIPSLLIVNRGMFFMILTACLFVYLLSLDGIRTRVLLYLSTCIFILFFVFGVIGNLRISNGETTSNEYILQISRATEEFKDSFVPNEFIWSYLYISSPLANFQNTLDNAYIEERKWKSFFILELIPDFISKRLAPAAGVKEESVSQIADWLNVSTFYAGSFNYIGWAGPVLMFCFLVFNVFVYLTLLRKSSRFYVTGLAILNTMILYNTFDNMFTFTGLSFQLVYPLLLSYVKVPTFRVRPKAT